MKNYIVILLLSAGVLQAETYTVGFAQDTLSNDWRKAQVEEAKRVAEQYPFLALEVKDAQAKSSLQILHLDEFIAKDVDAILTSPFDTPIMSQVLQKARDKGIAVVLISRGVSSDAYDVFVAPDNYNIGVKAAEYLLEQMDYKGRVLMLQGVAGVSTTLQREEGFESVASQYKAVSIIKKRANFLRSDAIRAMEELYASGAEFDAIYSHSDSMLEGVREAMARHKKDFSIPMVGIDYIKAAKTAILEGKQSASFTYPTVAKEGIEAVVQLLQGEKVPRHIEVDSVRVTPENVSEVEPIF
jgi:ribose transport system substrate-binding protein